ncbi:thiamine diphosphokinase [Myroides sp. 1354]|uniref:thiamine diphosphokinase n=1 Tax=unclassified Myroides TaxID=2642485 RepID=UPI00257903C2|nr:MULTISPECIES: thiamine diphosphokinase [unclassified Myroides]MDM1045829.1 thiamine diphosphokinase [Myroides sp. R163-1]MDM1055716.1 thiamine diphosphokinase [Myroides sp. 1354]MDM1069808.1 thiamine diphosphokinase [Myroides sp. 1372]
MSSHHIVRDDQEPALIIANGAACSQDLLDQLLEWSPYIVVLDQAIERVIELNIKVDVLIGDFDRDFDPSIYLAKQYPLEIVHSSDQETTDLEKALNFLLTKGIKAANVVWATGKRADHTFTNITTLVKYRDSMKIVILDDYSKIFRLPNTYKKWYTKDTILSLIPVGKAGGITTTNLHYPLQNEELALGIRTGSSNSVVEDGIVSITYESGDLLLMECTD